MSSSEYPGKRDWLPDAPRLVLLSFLMLFLELALIRWTAENVVYLSYFSNFVLLGSFLGIGIGFIRPRSWPPLFRWTPVALVALVAFVRIFPVEIDRSGSEVLYFGAFERSGLPPWVMLPVIFVAVAVVMAMVADGVARTFVRFPPLEAYRLDIMGAIAGVAGFSALSLLHAPPVIWGVVVAGLLVLLVDRADRHRAALYAVTLVAMLGLQSALPTDTWSPYYRVSAWTEPGLDGHFVSVNGIPHQIIQDTRVRRSAEPIYFRPYELMERPPDDVLIVGAGNGTDVAIALEQGVKRVDAVEIDPVLYRLGVELHPDRPYADPRVTAHITDGRAFLEQTDRRYDLIVFALPDSLTLVSGQSSIRLESYLFTVEAFQQVEAHLRPGGTFAMYNYYREGWLVDRLGGLVTGAFGRPPCVESVGSEGGHLALLLVGGDLRCQPIPTAAVETVTDDYPFLYLRERGIPAVYLLTLALILGLSAVSVRAAAGPIRRMGPYLDLFLMGAAFLLLETKNVVQFALLFGTTWFVNALVFAGVLLSVLAAVEVARLVTLPPPGRLYLALLGTLAVAWLVPQHLLLHLDLPVRFVVAVLLAFTPIFIANLVFAQRFKHVGSSAVAFGANLLGAMVGGVLEYAALVVGYRSLLLVVAVLYGLAFLAERRALRGGSGESAEELAIT